MNILTLKFKIKNLQKLCDENYKDFKKAKKKAQTQNMSNEDIQELTHTHSTEYELIKDEIMELNTQYIVSQSQKLILPLPDYQDDTIWDISKITGMRNLTNKGVAHLRSAIRKEQQERREGVLLWTAAITGIIGAIIGLIAIIKT